MKKFLIGATSFYVVAFSTLLLVIIAASFATVILSEVGRSSNDDLSQSAYDSALAGVEDAKLAYSNYLRCQDKNTSECNRIRDLMQNPSCDMVAKILGRDYVDGQGVLISETTEGDNMLSQYYTCVKIDTKLPDYRANLTRDNNVRIVKASFEGGTTANDIEAIEFSWYTRRSTETLKFTNFNTGNNNWSGSDRVTFTPVGETQPSTPPTMALQIVQTAERFNLGSYNGENGYGVNSISQGGQTDRATLYLVPTDRRNISGSNFVNTYNGTNNVIGAASVAATNDQSIAKKPFVVYCDGGEGDADFVCSVKIYLPRPIGGSRNNDTFMILVTLPYGEPDTDFGIEYLCADGTSCGNSSGGSSNGDGGATISGTQVTIDSTGRANDLFRRVETRLETTDTSFPYTYYALELLGDGDTLRKVMIVTSEYNFYF